MTDHIYGRKNILTHVNRPHMFIAELYLYIDFLKEQLAGRNTTGSVEQKKNTILPFIRTSGMVLSITGSYPE